MKINIFIIFLMFVTTGLFSFSVSAATAAQFEESSPYIELSASKTRVKAGEDITFLIQYGNQGPQMAKNIKIILNQPLDGRSPLKFIAAQPQPDNWISSEYGNLAEFTVDRLETYEATEESKISIKVKVRESVAQQTLAPSASLQALNREIGKRMLVSQPFSIEIISDLSETAEPATPSASASSGGETNRYTNQDVNYGPESDEKEQNQTAASKTIFLNSDTLRSTLTFFVICILLAVAFFAGKKSVRN